MGLNINWKRKNISETGLFDLDMIWGEIGTGHSPFVSITTLVHGNERYGLFTLHRLIKEYLPFFEFTGTLRIVPVSNPLAALTNTRSSFLDFIDMNREGIGSPHEEITKRSAFCLYEIVKNSDLVINFHEFETNSKLLCVFTNSGSKSLQKKVLSSILDFSPEIIWSIPSDQSPNISKSQETVLLSFDSALSKAGTPIFSIEFTRGDLVDEIHLNQCIQGLIRVLESKNIILNKDDSLCHTITKKIKPKAFYRKAFFAPSMGIWNPNRRLMDDVKKDDLIGTFDKLPYFKNVEILAPYSGTILQIRPNEIIGNNDILFGLGTPDTELQKCIEKIYFTPPPHPLQ